MIYIAGSFTGNNAWEIENNVRAAEEYLLLLMKKKILAYCPHTHFRFFHGSVDEHFIMEHCFFMLSHCSAIFVLPGSSDSSGTAKEIMYAQDHGIPVYDTLCDLMAKENKEK